MDIDCSCRYRALRCLQVKAVRMLGMEPRILWTVVELPYYCYKPLGTADIWITDVDGLD